MTKNTSFKIPNSFIKNLDFLVDSGFFSTRGEAIKIAIEEYIEENYSFLFKNTGSIDKKENNDEMGKTSPFSEI